MSFLRPELKRNAEAIRELTSPPFPSPALVSEIDITMERIKKILDAGANVILTTKGIDDLCLKPFVEAGAMAVRRVKKEDMKRIAKATGGGHISSSIFVSGLDRKRLTRYDHTATFISTLANLEGEETFEPSLLGHAEEVSQERISDDECILIKGTKAQSSASIILRGANDFLLDEMERSIHDSLSAVRRTLESGSVVPGGGAVETGLSIYLENFATTVVGLLAGLINSSKFSSLPDPFFFPAELP